MVRKRCVWVLGAPLVYHFVEHACDRSARRAATCHRAVLLHARVHVSRDRGALVVNAVEVSNASEVCSLVESALFGREVHCSGERIVMLLDVSGFLALQFSLAILLFLLHLGLSLLQVAQVGRRHDKVCGLPLAL